MRSRDVRLTPQPSEVSGRAGSAERTDRSGEPLRVLQVIDHLWFGGAQSVLLALLRLADSSRVRFEVVSLGGGDPELVERVTGLAGAFHSLPGGSLTDVRAVLALARLARRGRFEVLHAHLSTAEWYCGLAARLVGRPSLTTLHSVAGDRATYGRARAALSNLATRRLGNRLVAVSEAVRASHIDELGVSPERIVLVPNVPVAPLFLPQPFDRAGTRAALGLRGFVVCCASRLTPMRDHETLVRAVGRLAGEVPELSLVIVGDGVEGPALERLVRELQLETRVSFLGWRADAAAITAASDVMCQPSLYEGMPIAVLDAMSLGVPVVASSVVGIEGLIEDGRTGILVTPRSVDALSDALRLLHADASLRERIAGEARRTVERGFDPVAWMGAYEGLYQELAVDAGPEPRQ